MYINMKLSSIYLHDYLFNQNKIFKTETLPRYQSSEEGHLHLHLWEKEKCKCENIYKMKYGINGRQVSYEVPRGRIPGDR